MGLFDGSLLKTNDIHVHGFFHPARISRDVFSPSPIVVLISQFPASPIFHGMDFDMYKFFYLNCLYFYVIL